MDGVQLTKNTPTQSAPTDVDRCLSGCGPADGEEGVHVPVFRHWVDDQRYAVVLHADPQHWLDVGVLQPTHDGGLVQESGHLFTGSAFFY